VDADKLQAYRGKRDAARTPEPVPAEPAAATENPDGGMFVIQEHHARRLHWDVRLERDGVLVSWAVPKGVPDDPAVNHLAVHTEDHPLEYGSFEGEIPRGQYGAGSMTIWDSGRYETLKWAKDEVKIRLHGQRVTGGYTLFQTGGKQWMMHRERQPLPAALRPMLAALSTVPPPDDGRWALEFKWDGVRALAFVERGQVRLMSRTERDITVTYPELTGLGHATDRKQLLLDGEIVVFGEDGWPSFEGLQPRMHVSDAAAAKLLAGHNPVTYLVFDLLQMDGRPLLEQPYSARRVLLESLELAGTYWQTPPTFPGEDFAAVRDVSAGHGMEGVVAKRLDSRYQPGARTSDWRKIKNHLRQEAVVAGYKPGQGNRAGLVGSLLIGVNDDSGLIYAGHVGTGFNTETLHMLSERLEPLRRSSSPFDGPVPQMYARTAVWVEPRLVIDVAFDRWTSAGRMRAPVYKGLRDDKNPEDVTRE
jgi:bifunctional non-homologous end joining protein LigD